MKDGYTAFFRKCKRFSINITFSRKFPRFAPVGVRVLEMKIQIKKSGIVSLVGMTGCGKTSVGKRLAEHLGVPFVDLDEEIVKRRGAVKDIFAREGEEAFRKIEFEVLREIIRDAENAASAPANTSATGSSAKNSSETDSTENSFKHDGLRRDVIVGVGFDCFGLRRKKFVNGKFCRNNFFYF